MSSPSISDIVNAKIIELLLECCRKTVIECSNHYGFSSEEALGKMGLLTDYSSLFDQKMSIQNVSVSVSESHSDESVSVSDVSVKTPILNEKVSKPRAKKAEGEKKPRAKKEKKEVVVTSEEVKEVVKEEAVTSEVKEVAKEEVAVNSEVKEDVKKKVSKPRVKKEKVVKEDVKEDVKEEVKKKVSKPRVKKNPDDESKSSETKKGRPKKDKKETEAVSPIDDLFANLVAKEEEAPQVDVVNKMEFQGTTYLKSKNTGIIYNMEQDVVGKWNENTKTIDFEEEEEEEYEDE